MWHAAGFQEAAYYLSFLYCFSYVLTLYSYGTYITRHLILPSKVYGFRVRLPLLYSGQTMAPVISLRYVSISLAISVCLFVLWYFSRFSDFVYICYRTESDVLTTVLLLSRSPTRSVNGPVNDSVNDSVNDPVTDSVTD